MIKISHEQLPYKFIMELRDNFNDPQIRRKYDTTIHSAELYAKIVNDHLEKFPYYIRFIDGKSYSYKYDSFEFTEESYSLFLLQYS